MQSQGATNQTLEGIPASFATTTHKEGPTLTRRRVLSLLPPVVKLEGRRVCRPTHGRRDSRKRQALLQGLDPILELIEPLGDVLDHVLEG